MTEEKVREIVRDEIQKITRISQEQVEADDNFKTKLEESLNAYTEELKMIDKDMIDQALIDRRENDSGNLVGKSNRYLTLEKRAKDLHNMILEAQEKLGKVELRAANPAFANLINQTLNNVNRSAT